MTSSWGVGVLKLAGPTMAALMVAANGTLLGNWVLNTADNQFGIVGGLVSANQKDLFGSSPWGIALLRLAGSSMTAPILQPNGFLGLAVGY